MPNNHLQVIVPFSSITDITSKHSQIPGTRSRRLHSSNEEFTQDCSRQHLAGTGKTSQVCQSTQKRGNLSRRRLSSYFFREHQSPLTSSSPNQEISSTVHWTLLSTLQ